MDEAVAFARGGVLKEGGGEDALAAGGEDDFDGIVHAAGHDRLDAGAVGARSEDVGGAGGEFFAVGQRVGLFGERAFAPVNPAVGAQIRSVQIVGAAGEGF